jgi:hypothetical protein
VSGRACRSILSWTARPATEIQPGVIIRVRTGEELEVARVETSFLGRGSMVAFVQDTPAGWRRAPFPTDAEVQFRSAS